MKLANQKSLFTIPPDVTYLNCAMMSPILKSSSEAGLAAVRRRNEPWSIPLSDWFEPAEKLKGLFASVINSPKDNIALIPSVSYGMAVAKQNIHLGASDEILVLDRQYPSNVYAWMELAKETGAKIITVRKNEDQNWTEAILHHVHERTGLVAIPNCHWTNGELIDLKKISAATRTYGAKLVIDASQSAGVYPMDIQAIRPDFLVTAGYKWLLGPYGLSYFYADEKYFENGKPIEHSWNNKKGSEDFTSLVDYTEDYKYGAARFDAGGSAAFINMPMAIEALTRILEWGVHNIQETLAELTNKVLISARERGLVVAGAHRVGHMLGIKMDENKVKETGTRLIENKIFISFRGASMRIAPYLYNDHQDIEQLFKFL
ncbi:MAG TPA: aminotransferase class V-fold PLP-dependent enzyme [Chitinophagaceae bacterium]|nr:aminotransferase class V-fold PLP-dependent enzyme [Chitinophagaceae bacterium]